MFQDRKYEFVDGGVRNRASGQMIPEDEPVFVFRARDFLAIDVLEHYSALTGDAEHRAAIEKRIEDFARFRNEHHGRMKYPNTDMSGEEWAA